MKTLLLNGSPNGEYSNSQILLDHFNKGFPTPCEVICIRNKDPHELALYMREFPCVIIAMPLYIHAMPGIVMKLFEAMQFNEDQKLGFIIQSGFIESSQSRFALRIFEQQTKRLGSLYLGTVIKPDAAGVKMMPEQANMQLFEQLQSLGMKFSQTGQFDKMLTEQLGFPIKLTPNEIKQNIIKGDMGLLDDRWSILLKKHHAFSKRADRPFLE